MATRPVQIISGNATNGTLVLDKHRREAHAGDTILWHIKNHSGVYSIISIEPKPDAQNIWQTPPAPQGSNWRGVIKSSAPDNYDYNYLIKWKATKDGNPLTQDPIITIRPTGVVILPDKYFFIEKAFKLIIALVLMLTGISILLMWMKKWKKPE